MSKTTIQWDPTEPITREALLALGFATDDEKAAGEFIVRVVGGDDDGRKRNSNDDGPDDEIAELIVSPEDAPPWRCYLETYNADSLNTISIIGLGTRETMAEIIALCRALKAWAVRYPGGAEPRWLSERMPSFDAPAEQIITPGIYRSDVYHHDVEVIAVLPESPNIRATVRYRHLTASCAGEEATKTLDHFKATYRRAAP